MDTKRYQIFWSTMVFLLSFLTAGFFLGAMLLYRDMTVESDRDLAYQTSLTRLLSLPANCDGRKGD